MDTRIHRSFSGKGLAYLNWRIHVLGYVYLALGCSNRIQRRKELHKKEV